MTSIDDLKHDVKNAQNNVLGDLKTEERLRLFIQEAAADREERIEWLADTAPRHEYTATDLEYMDGTKKLSILSLAARHELQKLYQAVDQHETARDKYMALMILNEALSHLSQGEFEIDEFGHVDTLDHDDADYAYGKTFSPGEACLATKYRELWEDLPVELLLSENDRTIKRFPGLAAAGLLGYPSDLSGEAFDDFDKDRVSSEVYLSDLRLLNALVDFHTHFHGWRLFAEEHLDVTLDELLNVSTPPTEDDIRVTHGISEIDEQLCRNILSLKRDYLEAYPTLLKEWADDGEEIDVDLDARAQEYADVLAEASNLPV